MRNLLFALFALMVIAGCGNEDDSVEPVKNRYEIFVKTGETGYIGELVYYEGRDQVRIYNYSANHNDFHQVIDTVASPIFLGVMAKDGGEYNEDRVTIEIWKNGVLRADTVFREGYMNERIVFFKEL